MNKKIIIKIITSLLIIGIFLIFTNVLNVQAATLSADSPMDISVNPNSIMESVKTDDILCYDATTKQTTKVDMEELKQVLVATYGENYTSFSTDYLLSSKNHSISSNEQVITSPSIRDWLSPKTISYNTTTVTPYASSTFYAVTNPRVNPYSAICKIICDNGNASGFLVQNNKLLTAGHCVINRKTKQPYNNWACYPAYDNGAYKGYSAGWSKIYYSKDWLDNGNSAADWCLCILGTNLGQYVGVCTAEEGADAVYKNASVKSYGYATAYYSANYQCYIKGNVSNVQPTYFKTNSILSAGMSGGPTIRDATNRAIGINVGIYDDYSGSLLVRMTEDLFSLILS